MKRLLVSGYYGFNNLGDEAVLESILLALRRSFDDIEITVLSANSASTQKMYGVKTVSRNAPLKILKALWNCDILISGGGSLLQDVTNGKKSDDLQSRNWTCTKRF
jgi:polysaccharide pyruvyl transferase WcaK-like protein